MKIHHTVIPARPCASFNEWHFYLRAEMGLTFPTTVLSPKVWRTLIEVVSGAVEQEIPGTFSVHCREIIDGLLWIVDGDMKDGNIHIDSIWVWDQDEWMCREFPEKCYDLEQELYEVLGEDINHFYPPDDSDYFYEYNHNK